MKKTLLILVVMIVAAGRSVEAQRRGEEGQRRPRMEAPWRGGAVSPELGIRGSYDFDRRDFGVGGQAQIPLMRALSLVPSGDLFFGEERTWQANADVAVNLRVLRAGGGLALVDGAFVGDPDGDPELGLNLFTGIHAPRGTGSRARPYAEARWTFLENETPFRLAAGVNLRLGGRRR